WTGGTADRSHSSGKNATTLRKTCGLSVSRIDHQCFRRVPDRSPHRGERNFLRSSTDNCSIGTIISSVASPSADCDVGRRPARFPTPRNGQAGQQLSGATRDDLLFRRLIPGLGGVDVQFREIVSLYFLTVGWSRNDPNASGSGPDAAHGRCCGERRRHLFRHWLTPLLLSVL